MEKPKIPDYEIKSLCGSGAYGDVWLCLDRNGIVRAVKALDKTRLESLGVLQREEKAIQLYRTLVLKHRNLIEIFHIGETPSHIYYVMPPADNVGTGGKYVADTLDNRLRDRVFSPEESISFITDMLDAVEVLHDAGLVHRDIKPSNIIFVDNIPKLADIGLVTSTDATMSIAGTMHFIPPEKATGNTADIYSIGKLLYCVMTGRPVQEFPTLPDRMRLSKDPVIMRLNKVVLKACSKRPENRFESAKQFRAALHGDSKAMREKTGSAMLVALILLLAVSITITVLCHFHGYKFFMLPETPFPSTGDKDESREFLKYMEGYRKKIASREYDKAIAYLNEISTKWPQMKDSPELLRMHAKAENFSKNPPSIIEDPVERKEFAKEILRINSALAKGEWQRVIDGVNMIKEKWPQFDHSGLDKVSARAAAEIEKSHVKAEADKTKLENEKAKLEVELERAKLETEKAKFETTKIKADNEKVQTPVKEKEPEIARAVQPEPEKPAAPDLKIAEPPTKQEKATSKSKEVSKTATLPKDKAAWGKAEVGGADFVPFQKGKQLWRNLTNYIWGDIPDGFKGMAFSKYRDGQTGTAKVKILKDGLICMAVTTRWGGGGGGGEWQKECLTDAQIKSLGWEETGRVQAIVQPSSLDWIIYRKNCKKGETFSYRTEKYCAPVIIVLD
jgi:serine/threonine protein kinase